MLEQRGDEDEDHVRREDAATPQEAKERAPRDRRGNAQAAALPASSRPGRISNRRVSVSRADGGTSGGPERCSGTYEGRTLLPPPGRKPSTLATPAEFPTAMLSHSRHSAPAKAGRG